MASVPIRGSKARLIDFAVERFGVRSIVDLGACWGVDGGYTFHAVRQHGLGRAVIVDGVITDGTRKTAAEHPQVQLIQGALGDPKIAELVGQVDAAILFDVLLHQVDPDWDELLELYSERAETLIIYNQGWLGSDTIRLVDFDVDTYIRRVPHSDPERLRSWYQRLDEHCEQESKPWRDVHYFWQWGITAADLVAAIWRLGYRVEVMRNMGGWRGFPDWELVGLICHRRSDRRGGEEIPRPLPAADDVEPNQDDISSTAALQARVAELQVEVGRLRRQAEVYRRLRNSPLGRAAAGAGRTLRRLVGRAGRG